MTEQREVFILDSDTLINIHTHFPNKLRKLKKSMTEGRVKIPEGVLREIIRRADKLSKNLKNWVKHNPNVMVKISHVHNLENEIKRLEVQYGNKIQAGRKEYPGFWKSPSGRKAADSQVVAAAKVLRGIVVSDDRAIHLACMLENVPCIGWTEFARQEEISSLQLEMF